MFTFIIVLSLLVSLLLVLVVLMQNKGQGMSMSSGANQIFGASRSTDLIEKTTWALAGTLVALAILSSAFTGGNLPEETEQIGSPVIEKAKEQSGPAQGGESPFGGQPAQEGTESQQSNPKPSGEAPVETAPLTE